MNATRLASVAALVAFLGLPACAGSASGSVVDADDRPEVGCLVGAVQLFDAAGHRVQDADPVLTRTDGSGHWSLDGLGSGTHLVFAWQPAAGSSMPETGVLVAMGKDFAKGRVPPAGRHARDLVDAERNTTSIGIDLSLGLSAGEGVHFAGKLSGPLLSDRLDYVISASVMRGEMPAGTDNGIIFTGGQGRIMRTTEFLGTADEQGHFDLGWVLPGDPVNISVSAIPTQCVQLARRALALDGDLIDAEIAIPPHEIRRLRVTRSGASADDDQPATIRFWEPGHSSGGGSVGPDGGFEVIVQSGGMLFQATAEGLASTFVAVEPAVDGSAGEVVLDLLPEPHNVVTLEDESGHPIAGAWIFVGTRATAGFADPYPLFSVTDDAGKLRNLALPLGTYPAQLVHDKGSYDEWRVNFDIEVREIQNTVTVPLSSKDSVHK